MGSIQDLRFPLKNLLNLFSNHRIMFTTYEVYAQSILIFLMPQNHGSPFIKNRFILFIGHNSHKIFFLSMRSTWHSFKLNSVKVKIFRHAPFHHVSWQKKKKTHNNNSLFQKKKKCVIIFVHSEKQYSLSKAL